MDENIQDVVNSELEATVGAVDKYMHKAIELAMEYGPKIILAFVVLFVGLKIISSFTKILGRILDARHIDVTLRPFIIDLSNWLLKAVLFISVASMVGIETTSFVALIGAAGLAVGLALQGTLANFAGGVLILLFKPYVVGDLVDMQGFLGNVQEIDIFVTKLITPENKLVIIPNGAIANGSLTNFSARGELRVDMVVGVSYNSDLKKSKEVLMKVLTDHPKVLKNPAPLVAVNELADSSVNFVVRPHAMVEDYWDVRFDILEQSKIALDEAGIEIPFPQRDVHLFEHKS